MAISLKNVPRGFLIVGSCLLVAVAVAFLGYAVLGPQKAAPGSSTKGLTPKNVEGAVGGAGSSNYNQMLEEYNRQQAQQAEAKGQSHFSTIVGEDRQEVEEKPPVVAARPKTAQPTVPAARSREQAQQAQAQDKAMMADLKSLAGKRGNNRDNLPVVTYIAAPPQISPPAGGAAQASPETAVQAVAKPGGLKVGDMLYAVNMVAVNSDLPSPIVARVVQGELRGAKVMGSFQRHQESLLISFHQLVKPSGEIVGLSAVAIDPQTSTAAIANEVNTHFFSRWGSLIASSFIEGFGSAMTNRNTRVQSNGDIMMQETNKSYADVSLEALGKVGQRTASQVERNFDRPPTVHVKVGEPFGVLILGLGG